MAVGRAPAAASRQGAVEMAKYLVIANYTSDGVKGLLKDGGSSRREAVRQVAEGLGGSLESFYFGFGADDAYITFDAPDNATAAAASLVVNASGAVTSRTVVLLTPEEMDAATQKSVDYRPPGG